MGVSGAGKTTVGRLLAELLSCDFYDADDFHTFASRAKMRSGTPLSDQDREPWLASLSHLLQQLILQKKDAVLACSALKAAYRRQLQIDENIRLVYLKGDLATVQKRLARREGHFMPPELLDSQFAALEEPNDAITVGIESSPAAIAAKIKQMLRVGN